MGRRGGWNWLRHERGCGRLYKSVEFNLLQHRRFIFKVGCEEKIQKQSFNPMEGSGGALPTVAVVPGPLRIVSWVTNSVVSLSVAAMGK